MTAVAVHMVNLTRAADRRALMADLCADRGIAVSYFPAVDGRDPAQAARLAALPDHGPIGPFLPHGKACTLSHLDIMRLFLVGDAAFCLILEDDIFIAEDLADWLQDMAWWPQGSDLVKLERWRDDRLVVALGRHGQEHLGRSLRPLRSKHSGTGGYLISRQGAEKVLAAVDVHPMSVSMPIDHLLFNPQVSVICRSLRITQIEPALIVQGNEPPVRAPQPLSAATVQIQPSVADKLRRGWIEARAAVAMLALWAGGRIRPAHITYADRIQPSGA